MKMKLRASFLTIALISSTSVMAAPVQWGSTGHWYEYFDTLVTATEAVTLAQASTFSGMHGYLATITSSYENWFVANDVASGSTAFIGGSDAGDEGNWTWRAGPETGQSLTYTNWASGEPNNNNDEDYILTNWGIGFWNDMGVGPLFTVKFGYVVEYGDTLLSPVPEPETYAMLLAGLGLLGFMAPRRKETVL
ncbi:PEP-CTERM sorting domain-containing protein [Nitrosomonas sp.]|uniref:PEP-CTERM sorting domain-containing protein n=1 Tax=Nitrosomonas sp. TaxID=42353 RepID=UPI0025D43119|nr:PEP-CTERM sorting domain-containing protein [Nitrosomonas sp.]